MARIRLYSHAASDTIGRLKDSLEAAGHNVKKLKRVGGTYRGRAGDIVFNYGSSSLEETTVGEATCLNAPLYINRASNKREAFGRMAQANVKTVEFTSDRSVAEGWLNEGALVYVRNQLQGHSGAGITLAFNNPTALGDAGNLEVSATVPQAPLYTKGVLGNRREYRVHVFKGKIIHVAQKRRRDGFAEIEGNNNLVRNHHTGWVYSTQNMTALNAAGKREAIKAINAIGLDFGAVDIITNRDQAWVLEVNTAPGMEGVTLEKYVTAIGEVAEGREVSGETVDLTEPQEQPNATNASRRTQHAVPPAPGETANQATAAARPQPAQQEAPTAPQSRPAASGRQPARNAALIDNGYYWLTFNGEQTIGQYVESQNSFNIIGWELPISRDEATVGAQINR